MFRVAAVHTLILVQGTALAAEVLTAGAVCSEGVEQTATAGHGARPAIHVREHIPD